MTTTPPTFDPEQAARAFQEALKEAARNARGLQVVAQSHDLPVGLTPKDTIWTLNKAKLYRYHRAPGSARRTPLLLVYALINKPYIFDLRPGRSFIEYLVSCGFDVFLLDWGVPGPEDRRLKLDDYVAEYIPRAVRKVLRVSGADELNMMGYCIGATLAAMYAALPSGAPLRNLVLLTPPLDFSKREDSLFARWLDERYFDVDHVVDTFGNLPVELIETWSKMLKPVENFVGTYTSLWGKLEDEVAVEGWQALHRWVHDGIPMAGEAFRQWVKDLVRANKLVKGEMIIRGQRVSLSNIRVPLLNVVAQYDHIVPPSQSLSVMDLVSSRDKRLETIPAGHVGIVVGRGAQKGLWPLIGNWLAEHEPSPT
jgi:polyhydroxyalkanoate synthase